MTFEYLYNSVNKNPIYLISISYNIKCTLKLILFNYTDKT